MRDGKMKRRYLNPNIHLIFPGHTGVFRLSFTNNLLRLKTEVRLEIYLSWCHALENMSGLIRNCADLSSFSKSRARAIS